MFDTSEKHRLPGILWGAKQLAPKGGGEKEKPVTFEKSILRVFLSSAGEFPFAYSTIPAAMASRYDI